MLLLSLQEPLLVAGNGVVMVMLDDDEGMALNLKILREMEIEECMYA